MYDSRMGWLSLFGQMIPADKIPKKLVCVVVQWWTFWGDSGRNFGQWQLVHTTMFLRADYVPEGIAGNALRAVFQTHCIMKLICRFDNCPRLVLTLGKFTPPTDQVAKEEQNWDLLHSEVPVPLLHHPGSPSWNSVSCKTVIGRVSPERHSVRSPHSPGLS